MHGNDDQITDAISAFSTTFTDQQVEDWLVKHSDKVWLIDDVYLDESGKSTSSDSIIFTPSTMRSFSTGDKLRHYFIAKSSNASSVVNYQIVSQMFFA